MSRELSLTSPSSLRDGLYKLWRKFTAPNSTSALQTGKHWTDDKPIYRKVVAVAAGPNSSTVNTAHGITGLGTVISVSGMLDNATIQVPLPFADSAAAATQIEMSLTDTNIVLISGASGDYSGYAGHVILEYTLA